MPSLYRAVPDTPDPRVARVTLVPRDDQVLMAVQVCSVTSDVRDRTASMECQEVVECVELTAIRDNPDSPESTFPVKSVCPVFPAKTDDLDFPVDLADADRMVCPDETAKKVGSLNN